MALSELVLMPRKGIADFQLLFRQSDASVDVPFQASKLTLPLPLALGVDPVKIGQFLQNSSQTVKFKFHQKSTFGNLFLTIHPSTAIDYTSGTEGPSVQFKS